MSLIRKPAPGFVAPAWYNGDFVDGKMEGKGVYRNEKGKVYEGDFVDGTYRGKAVFRYALVAFIVSSIALIYKYMFT